MQKDEVDKWYHLEVMGNRDLYPNLYDLEVRKTRYKFEQKRYGGN